MLKYLTTLIAAITPLMYFHGSVFHDSYLRALGIPPDLFRLSFEGALVQGYMAYMLLSAYTLLILIMGVMIALGIAYNLNEASKISSVKKIIAWVGNRLKKSSIPVKTLGNPLTEKAVKWVGYVFFVVLCLGVLLWASIGIAIKIETLGKENSINNIKGISKNSVLQELHLRQGNSIKGYILECSSYGCAIFVDNKVQIIPLAEIETIDALVNISLKL